MMTRRRAEPVTIVAAGAAIYIATLFLLGFRLADFDRRERS